MAIGLVLTVVMGAASIKPDGERVQLTVNPEVKRVYGLAATGTVEMIDENTTKKFRVLSLYLCSTSTTATSIYVHNDDNDIIGDATNAITLDEDTVRYEVTLPYNPDGYFDTDTVNQSLDVTLSAAEDVIYSVTYIEIE